MVERWLSWVPYPDGIQVTETVVRASDYDSLLAVLRRCVEALEWIAKSSGDTGSVETATAALAAARQILSGEDSNGQ